MNQAGSHRRAEADLQAKTPRTRARSVNRRAKSSKQAAGKSLHATIVEVNQVLSGKLDKLSPKFKKDQSGFYQAYSASRGIVDNPASRKAKPDGNSTGPVAPQ